MSGPFVTAEALRAELAEPTPPHVLDATYLLHPPAADGDHRGGPARDRWLEAHVPGAGYADVAADFSDPTAPFHFTHPEPQAVADALAASGVARDDRVVVYDTAGALWAARLWYLLRWIGVDVRVLDGGLDAWREAGGRVESGEAAAARPAPRWTAQPVRAAWITREELERRPASQPLVCGLSRGLFDGVETTRYARRGHIPGSVSVPARSLFTASGRIRPASEIVAAHRAAGVPLDGAEILLYCGGGISACASALALAHIGVETVRVYDASLEEWAADPALPLAVASV